MQKFPSIEQFRSVIHNVKHQARFTGVDETGEPIYNDSRSLPTIEFEGTVKLHGTNAGIVWIKLPFNDYDISFQSRERVLSETADNAGFWKWGNENLKLVNELFIDIHDACVGTDIDSIAIYGEWCGGNIQSGVALSQLPKMFVVFAVKIDDVWCDVRDMEFVREVPGMLLITDFPTYKITVDFEDPGLSQNKMIKITEAVEAECPVGAQLGAKGIGEGVVWKPTDPAWNSSKFWFKVKGDKHSASKVKKLAAVDVEALNSMNEFIEYAVTPARLEQGLQNLINEQQKPFAMQSLGDFIRWVFNDVVKEESDTIAENGLDPKKLGGPVANKARKWYVERMNSGA